MTSGARGPRIANTSIRGDDDHCPRLSCGTGTSYRGRVLELSKGPAEPDRQRFSDGAFEQASRNKSFDFRKQLQHEVMPLVAGQYRDDPIHRRRAATQATRGRRPPVEEASGRVRARRTGSRRRRRPLAGAWTMGPPSQSECHEESAWCQRSSSSRALKSYGPKDRLAIWRSVRWHRRDARRRVDAWRREPPTGDAQPGERACAVGAGSTADRSVVSLGIFIVTAWPHPQRRCGLLMCMA
jgi:hypothetical protein